MYYGRRVQSRGHAALGAKLSPVCPLRHHQPAPAVGAEGYSLELELGNRQRGAWERGVERGEGGSL